ncbi:hypothetical protein, partial [Sphingobacterium mizutaii]|uniref:hypothetical protein n=1 Tax=Sphingobacterium mizutaii TaxID=1010 RepID=UPI00289E47EB
PKGVLYLKNKRANRFSLPICCHHLPINLAQIFSSQDDPNVVNGVERLYTNTIILCIVPRSFLRQDDPNVVNVVERLYANT